MVIEIPLSLQAGTKKEKISDEDEDLGPVDGPSFSSRPKNHTGLDGECYRTSNTLGSRCSQGW